MATPVETANPDSFLFALSARFVAVGAAQRRSDEALETDRIDGWVWLLAPDSLASSSTSATG